MKKILILMLITLTLSAKVVVGDKINNFTLPDLYDTSKQISFNKNKSKVTLINLWASWCGGCKKEMPLFVKLQKKYKKNNFKIILSSIDKKQNNSIEFLNSVDKERVLLSLWDKDKILAKEYKAIGMPSSYLIDENLNIVKIFVGSLEESAMKELELEINKLLGKI